MDDLAAPTKRFMKIFAVFFANKNLPLFFLQRFFFFFSTRHPMRPSLAFCLGIWHKVLASSYVWSFDLPKPSMNRAFWEFHPKNFGKPQHGLDSWEGNLCGKQRTNLEMLWNSKNRNYKIHRKIESKEHIARNLRHHTPGHEGGTEIDAKCCRKVQFHECLLLHQNRKHWSRNCEIRGPLGAHPVILKTPCVQGKKRFFLGTTLSKRENIFAYSSSRASQGRKFQVEKIHVSQRKNVRSATCAAQTEFICVHQSSAVRWSATVKVGGQLATVRVGGRLFHISRSSSMAHLLLKEPFFATQKPENPTKRLSSTWTTSRKINVCEASNPTSYAFWVNPSGNGANCRTGAAIAGSGSCAGARSLTGSLTSSSSISNLGDSPVKSVRVVRSGS